MPTLIGTPAGQLVTFDTENEFAFTVPAGDRRALRVFVGVYAGSAVTITGVTYGGVPMTKVGSSYGTSNGNGMVEQYILVNPPAGANNVLITCSASAFELMGIASCYSNVNQATPTSGPNGLTSASSGNPSVSLTVAGSNIGVAGVYFFNEANTNPTQSDTLVFEQNATASNSGFAEQYGDGTLSWTISPAATLSAAGFVLVHDGGGGGTAISAGFDALVITERTAAKALSRNVVGALDALVITERAATVKVSRAVAAALDALTITEQAAVLRLSRSVVGAVDALVLTENQATVSVDTAIEIAAGLDALLIAEQAASTKLSRNVVAGFDSLAITEQAAVIRLAKAVAAQVDALLIAEHGAAISSGLSLAAAVDNLLITERTAAVNARRQVAASTDALLVSEQAAEVRLAKLVSAGVDALLLTEQQAVKALSKAIAAGVDQLLITEGQADVDGIAAVISVVAQRVVYPQRDGRIDIASRGQVTVGPRNSRITVH